MRSLVGYILILIGFALVALPILVLPFDLFATSVQLLIGLFVCAIGSSLIYGARAQMGYFRDWDERRMLGVGRINLSDEKPSTYVKVESLEGRGHIRVAFISGPQGAAGHPKITEVREFVGRRRLK